MADTVYCRGPFLWVHSDKPKRLGCTDFQQHYCIGPEPSTTGLNPNAIQVPGLGETGFKSMSSSGLSFPSRGDAPLLRGDVTRLVGLSDPSPLEDRGPLCLTKYFRFVVKEINASDDLC